MAVAQGPAAPRRRLGAELRRLREAANLHLDQVAEELGCSASKISRLETGKGIPKLIDVREMARIYGPLPEADRERLLRWAREGRRQTWWQDYADVLGRANSEFDRFVALENDASAFRAFELGVVHGLLQVPEYSRALIAATRPGLSAAEIDRLVQVRIRRREVLSRPTAPLRLHVVLDESALRRMVGGPAVMHAQLQHLVEVGEESNVDLQVLPFGSGALGGTTGTFVLIEFDDDDERDVVFLESRIDTYLEGASQVSEYAAAFARLSRDALGFSESAGLIRAMLPTHSP